MNKVDVFMTGGTGLIGRWLVLELTQMGQTVAILMRKAAQRAAEYRAWAAAHDGDVSKIVALEGDLAQPRLGLSDADYALAQTARNFYHLGAIQGFGLDRAVTESINVGGTKAMMTLAQGSARLNRFVLVSGFRLRVHVERGTKPEEIESNYEASKVRADMWVRETAVAENIPVTYIHPSVVIGDSRTGETTQFGMNFFTTLEDLWRGKVPAIPGTPQHWLPMTTVDYLAAFMARIPDLDWSTGQEYTILNENTPPLGQLLQQAAALMGVKAPSRYVPIPLLTLLLKAGMGKLTGQDPEALSFIDTIRYDTTAAQKAAAEMELPLPDFVQALQANISYQLATDFGRMPYVAGAGLRPTAGMMTYGLGNWRQPRVVLLHGLPLDAHSWDGVAAALPQEDVLRVDLPGNGRSVGSVHMDRVSWLDAVLADVTEPVLLVGHSLGTEFALRYAAARPEKVAGLLLISPFFLQGMAPLPLRHAAIGRLILSLINRSRYEQLASGQQMQQTPMLDSGYAALRRPRVRRNVAEALAAAGSTVVRDELA
ncbi:MAG: alpha/beta fold hydrolase, partial [Anaerolineales bacterium]|nr:alpha/beta fold hydrolase [Anaerolineales bacterium]